MPEVSAPGEAEDPGTEAEDPGTDGEGAAGQPVATLRGAGVQVDTARAGRVIVTVVLVALVVVGGLLVIAGYRKNSQIDALRSSGVPVQVTVVHCLGLMGGTGSSPAGYECTGRYVVQGRHFTEGVPGSTLYPDGRVIAGVVASGDPGLLSTPATVATSKDSATLYVVGAAMIVVGMAIGAVVVLSRRRRAASA